MPRALIPPSDEELRQAYACTDLSDWSITFDHAARLGNALRIALENIALIRRRREARKSREAAIPHQIPEA